MLSIVVLAFAIAPPVPPRLDAHGDPLPDGALFRLGTLRWRPPPSATTVAASPDGRWLALGRGSDHLVYLYDGRTGQRVAVFHALPDTPTEFLGRQDLLFSPDGTTLFWSDAGKTVRALRVPDGAPQTTFRHPSGLVLQLAVSGDGTELTTATMDNREWAVTRWETIGGKRLGGLTLPGRVGGRVVLSPRGDRVAFTTTESGKFFVRVNGVRTGKAILERELVRAYADPRGFSPDGRTLIVMGSRNTFSAVDVDTGKDRFQFGFDGFDVSFTPDSKAFFVRGYKTTQRLLDARTGEVLPAFETPLGQGAERLFFSADGKTATLMSLTLIRKVDVKTGKQLTPGNPDDTARGLAFSPDGKTLLVAGNGIGVRPYRLADGDPGRPFPAAPDRFLGAVAYSPDGSRLAAHSGPGRLTIWSTASGEALTTLIGPPAETLMHTLVFSPDGSTLYAPDFNQTVHRWAVRTGKALEPIAFRGGGLRQVHLAADGKALLACDDAGRFSALDLTTGKVRDLWSLASRELMAFAPMPGGKELAVAMQTGVIDFRDAETGTVRRSWQTGYTFRVVPSPDGKYLAGIAGDVIRLWDVATGRELRPIRTPGPFYLLAFSPDGRRLVTAGFDSIVTVWDVGLLTRAEGGPASALPPAVWLSVWEALGADHPNRRSGASAQLHAALEQTLDEMPRVIVHDATPENTRRAAVGRELLRRIGTPAARRLLERLAKAPPGSPWASP